MKKNLLTKIIATVGIVAMLVNPITAHAAEESSYYNPYYEAAKNYSYLVYKEEPEIYYEPSYVAWKQNKMYNWANPKPVNDYSWLITFDFDIHDSNICNYQTIESIYAFMDAIPAGIVDKLVSDGWKIIITNQNTVKYYPQPEIFAGWSPDRYPGGFCSNPAKLIVVQYYDGSNKTAIDLTHEIGHMVFGKYGFGLINTVNSINDVRQDNSLTTITRNSELGKVISHEHGTSYIYGDANELYADVLIEYIYYPLELKELAPTIFGIYNDVFHVY